MRTMMRTLAAVLLASLMLFGGAAAQAHDELVSSDPAANATLTQAPAELNLTYSANLMNIEGGNRVRVVDSTGASVAEGEPQVKGTTVTQPLKIKDASADETYTVTWRVVSGTLFREPIRSALAQVKPQHPRRMRAPANLRRPQLIPRTPLSQIPIPG